jgi:hypothetical protein
LATLTGRFAAMPVRRFRWAGGAFAERYHGACQLYFDEIARAEHATIVIWYDDFARPSLLRFSLMIGNWLAVSCQHGAHGD